MIQCGSCIKQQNNKDNISNVTFVEKNVLQIIRFILKNPPCDSLFETMTIQWKRKAP